MKYKIIKDDFRKVKKNCFAYDKNKNTCKALSCLYCKYENCEFYKTKEENIEQKNKAENNICSDFFLKFKKSIDK